VNVLSIVHGEDAGPELFAPLVAEAGHRLDESDPPPDPARLRLETRERIGAWNELGRRLCRSFLTTAERLA